VEEFASAGFHEGLERSGGLGLACVVVDELEDLGRVVREEGVVGRLVGGAAAAAAAGGGGERSRWAGDGAIVDGP
jgi:hypothetical protein